MRLFKKQKGMVLWKAPQDRARGQIHFLVNSLLVRDKLFSIPILSQKYLYFVTDMGLDNASIIFSSLPMY